MSAQTRRRALGLSAAGAFALMAMPARAAPDINQDADLIRVCDQIVAVETEQYLLAEYDEYAPDCGPNHARYKSLIGEGNRLENLMEECPAPSSPGGIAAIARAALTWVERDADGNLLGDDFGKQLLVSLAESLAPDFIWPPRPGDCSTAFWAPPTSPKEIAEYEGTRQARFAEIDARIQAEKAELVRRTTPALMTVDELESHIAINEKFRAIVDKEASELHAELERRLV